MSKIYPLTGIRVLDLTRILAGPLCTQYLGDLGAEIIKIENPKGGDDTRAWGPPFLETESAYYLGINRNKKSICLDIKTKEGFKILKDLIKKSDVVIDNFKPGFYQQCKEFLYKDFPKLKSIEDQIDSFQIYNKIAGYV